MAELMILTWPFLFAGFIGMIVWVWKERVFDRAVNTVRQQLEVKMDVVRADVSKNKGDAAVEISRLNIHVFGDDEKSGLKGSMEKMSSQMSKVIRRLDRFAFGYALWAQKEGITLPHLEDDDE